MSLYIKKFKEQEFDKRVKEAKSVRAKYPEKIPIIVGRLETDKYLNDVEKHKFLVPCDIAMSQFAYIIRKQIKLNHEQALFLFVNGIIVSSSTLMAKVYEENKDDDGYLYVTYASENTFGN